MQRAKRVIWAPRARRDLREIWSYYARVASPEIADDLLRDIAEAGSQLGRRALPGRSRDELKPGLRSVLVHPYTVFFRVAGEHIEIARVLHERRDFRSIFRE